MKHIIPACTILTLLTLCYVAISAVTPAGLPSISPTSVVSVNYIPFSAGLLRPVSTDELGELHRPVELTLQEKSQLIEILRGPTVTGGFTGSDARLLLRVDGRLELVVDSSGGYFNTRCRGTGRLSRSLLDRLDAVLAPVDARIQEQFRR